MRAREYVALIDALESGVAYGVSRADKHADDPLTPAQRARIEEHVYNEVLSAICERFRFEDAPDQ